MAKINILQIGEENWNEIYTTPEYVTLDHVDSLKEAPDPLLLCEVQRVL